MSKTVTSPSKRFKGSVVIADPLTIPQAKLIEDAGNIGEPRLSPNGRAWLTNADESMLPAIFACVEKWELTGISEGVTLETFPASPRSETHELIAWIYNEIFTVYIGEVEIPNE